MRALEVLFRECSYDQALQTQRALAARAGVAGILLFRCEPTITLGKRASPNDVRCSDAQLTALGVRKLAVDRGGLVTFHGPGQLVGFPFGQLEAFVGNPRGVRAFVVGLKRVLESFIAEELKRAGAHDRCSERMLDLSRPDDHAGVWLRDGATGLRCKIVSMGLGFGASGVRHGFSLNVVRRTPGFELIYACGERESQPAYLCEGGEQEYLGVVDRLSAAFARPGAFLA